MEVVAQLVEHWIVVPVVAGSIPVFLPKKPFFKGFFYFPPEKRFFIFIPYNYNSIY
tara:strand:+ start:344 stop:511 length:168 start_codon:yes stop_codon:yes gene_type:complete